MPPDGDDAAAEAEGWRVRQARRSAGSWCCCKKPAADHDRLSIQMMTSSSSWVVLIPTMFLLMDILFIVLSQDLHALHLGSCAFEVGGGRVVLLNASGE